MSNETVQLMLNSKGIATAPETCPTSAFQHVLQVTNYVVGAGISIGDTCDGSVACSDWPVPCYRYDYGMQG
ncbi:hypothetical protein F1880_004348 [Penicillium rolfsii]|nr:hypothetical protein F1880_004348 [Penicillium rolfsii]